MTHFIGAVLVPEGIAADIKREHWHSLTAESEALYDYLHKALDRFDESRTVAPYRDFEDNAIEDAAKYYEREPSIDDLENWDGRDWRLVDGKPVPFSTYNPDSRWDWWTVGGRWKDEYRERQGETMAAVLPHLQATLAGLKAGENLRPAPAENTPVTDPDRRLPWWFPAALVVPNGGTFDWIEQGKVGWFGSRADTVTETEWTLGLIERFQARPSADALVYIDFHI